MQNNSSRLINIECAFHKYNYFKHPFYLVIESPWPFYISVSLFFFLLNLVKFFHGYQSFLVFTFIFFILFIFSTFYWIFDVANDEDFIGQYCTSYVLAGIQFGVLLFILSEVLFFFCFFWSFFHFSLIPSIWVGGIWPPVGISSYRPNDELPLLNTLILFISGIIITYAHSNLTRAADYTRSAVYFSKSPFLIWLYGIKVEESIVGLRSTIECGIFFTLLQYYESVESNIGSVDSIYGSIFYLITGFHGLHVIIGTVFLQICFNRMSNYAIFLQQIDIGFEVATWYWHFVDIIWLFLFIFIYWWGS